MNNVVDYRVCTTCLGYVNTKYLIVIDDIALVLELFYWKKTNHTALFDTTKWHFIFQKSTHCDSKGINPVSRQNPAHLRTDYA